MHPDRPQHTHYDIGGDIGLGSTCQEDMIIQNILTDDEYLDLVQNLNDGQLSIFNHVIYITKTSSEPFHIFLSGGAGVGKSHLLKCLCQALHIYYDTVSGENPDEIKVVVGAPTTKAAFGVRGSTLHSLFALTANQSLAKYRHLDHS